MSSIRRKILLVHTGPLSSILMTLHAIETLHKNIADLDIHILTTELGGIFFEKHTLIKKIHILPISKQSLATLRLLPRIKAEAYLGIIFFHGGFCLKLMGRLSHIPIRIGSKSWPGRLFFTHAIQQPDYLHQADVYLKFLDPLDLDVSPKECPIQDHFSMQTSTPKWILKHLAPGRKSICLFLDESYQQGQSGFDYLMEKIVERGDFNLIICSNKPLTQLSTHKSILDVSGKLGLPKLIEVLEFSTYVISSNLAITQLATLLQKPLVSLLSNTPFFSKRFGPQTPYFVLLLPDQTVSQEALYRGFETLENMVQFQDPLSERKQRSLLALASYKVMYLTLDEALSLPEYRAIVDFKQQGLDIMPISLPEWTIWGILKTIKSENVTIIQGHLPWLLPLILKVIGPLYLGYKPLCLRQKFHRYIRLKEYLAMYQSVENRVK